MLTQAATSESQSLVTVFMDNHSTEVESQGNDYITLASRMSHIDTRLDEVKESTDSRMRKLTICLDKALKKIDGMETRLEEAEKLKEKVADLEARLAEFTEIYGDPTGKAEYATFKRNA